ncbi:uncharacterized protein C10orf143 homolog isoform X2 [Cygnus atratus]|uniref:uncharacterized protein C10orf143 homolog isoform X2 n=1 Tax=Cygnus atratus TaxID=8868 RepID=UPI0015D58860|nr:uncharacterized protein C10orf143 homolog isoform X2 [Cygnus atratus]
MEALSLPAPGRRGPPGAAEPGEPPRKRVCKLLETFPNAADARLIDCAMELDSKQKLSSGCGPWDTKPKPNSMIFENQGSRGTAQPCPRCIAGESLFTGGRAAPAEYPWACFLWSL